MATSYKKRKISAFLIIGLLLVMVYGKKSIGTPILSYGEQYAI